LDGELQVVTGWISVVSRKKYEGWIGGIKPSPHGRGGNA
jgi:hypothetical protein